MADELKGLKRTFESADIDDIIETLTSVEDAQLLSFFVSLAIRQDCTLRQLIENTLAFNNGFGIEVLNQMADGFHEGYFRWVVASLPDSLPAPRKTAAFSWRAPTSSQARPESDRRETQTGPP